MKIAILCAAAAVVLTGCSSAPPPAPVAESKGVGTIARLDPALDALVPKDAVIEKLAGGFQFVEGPLWRPDGRLWFSDVAANMIRQWSPANGAGVVLEHAGYDKDPPAGTLMGPNGEIADKDGAVLVCQHGMRRIVRVGSDLKMIPVVERFEGKRFNSPNDLVNKSDGSLWFTDPPYGLAKQDDDPAKELKFNGVFRLANGKLTAVVRDLTRPNGIAFSPDEKTLYVANSEPKKLWMRYDVAADGTVSNGRVLFDATSETEDGVPDGMKVDAQGNLYCAGPGGIWVFSPEGKHLGTIKPPEVPANCNWGDDGKSLYMTARTGLYRIKLPVMGQKALYQ